MGSIIVDLIIIIIFALSVLVAYKRGIASVIYNIVSWIFVFTFVFIFYEPVTNMVVDKTEFYEVISEKIESNLENYFEDDELINEEDSSISNAFINIINKYAEEAKENGVQNIAEYVADEISYMVISAIVMIVLFIFAKIVVLLLHFILEFVVSLPFIRTFNKVAGIVYGIFRAFLIIYVVLAVLSLLSPALTNTEIISSIKSSNIGSVFYNDNVILKFLNDI